MKKPLNAIPYFGGKTKHLPFLLSNMPELKGMHFVDGMCGSAAVALNVNATLVTINDINQQVINFFRVLRDKPEELIYAIQFTPFARYEVELCADVCGEDTDVEKARKFYVRSLQGFAGAGSQTTGKCWGNQVNIRPGEVCRVDSWNSKLPTLLKLSQKLRKFQIEGKTIFEIIDYYNGKNIFLFLDPPYVFETRSSDNGYLHEFTEKDHVLLAEKANASESMIMLCGYDSELYNDLFPSKRWHKVVGKSDRKTGRGVLKQECLWLNYSPVSTQPLF